MRRVLLRLHPWQDDHRAEEELARELRRRGYELAFALPQNRDLVRDLGRWRAAVEELGARFAPYGRHFQIGQAINRWKWGIWNLSEYAALAEAACAALRRHAGLELLGPAVIDFEFYRTAAALNLRRGSFASTSSRRSSTSTAAARRRTGRPASTRWARCCSSRRSPTPRGAPAGAPG